MKTIDRYANANEITSIHNPHVKLWCSLRLRKQREKTGLFLVEGLRAMSEAVQTGRSIEALIYCEQFLRSERACRLITAFPPERLWRVSEAIARRLSEHDMPGEVFGVYRKLDITLDELPAGGNHFFVVLDQPNDPGNLGTIVRTADGAGANGLIILEPAVDIYHPTAVYAAVGSLFSIPIARASQAEFLAWYARTWAMRPEAWIVATIPEAEQEYSALDKLERPLFVLFGNEQHGITPELRARSTIQVSIQMRGRADSLNLACAAAVIICDVMSKRRRI